MIIISTLPETNIAPENRWLEDWFPYPLGRISFSSLLWLINQLPLRHPPQK